MAKGQRRTREQILNDDIAKIDASLAKVAEKKAAAVAEFEEKEKDLKAQKAELEKELSAMKKNAISELIEKSGLSLEEIESMFKEKEKSEE